MTCLKYPSSVLPQNRHCRHIDFGKGNICPSFPCIHTPCHDSDWLEDQEDSYRDHRFYITIWKAFDFPEAVKPLLSPSEWEECVARFPRCRRLREKRKEISKILGEHYEWTRNEERKRNQEQFDVLPEETKRQQREKFEADEEVFGAFWGDYQRDSGNRVAISTERVWESTDRYYKLGMNS